MSKNPIGRPKGYVTSDATKKLIGAAHKGKVAANRRRISICGVEFDSFRIAAKELNINPSTLRGRVMSQTELWKEWIYL